MLEEYKFVNTEANNKLDILESWTFIWKCPNCGEQFLITKDNIEDFLYSQPHDPLQDYFICSSCESTYGLFKGVQGISGNHNYKALIWADGSFIYIKVLGKEYRIV